MSNQFSDIGNIISAPIIGMLNAEIMGAEATSEFIEKVGFTNPKSGESSHYGELKNITFTYKKPGTGKTVEVRIPLLSLIPIPMMQVKKAEFEFGLNVVKKFIPKNKKGYKDKDKFVAAIANDKDKNMNIKITVEQSDIPAGLSHLFQVMESSVDVK